MKLDPFIEADKAKQDNLKWACELLAVSRTAYDPHRAGTLSPRQAMTSS